MIYFFIILFGFTLGVNSQTYKEVYKHKTNYMYSVGLSTQTVLFDHPAANTMYFDNDKDFIEGGSFDGAQSGIDLRFMYILPENEKIYLSSGVDYTFFSSKEQYTVSNSSVTNYKHNINLLSPYIGAYYRILRIPLANTNIYFGPEIKFNYIHNGQFNFYLQNIKDKTKSLEINDYYKDNTFRFGGLLRIGAESVISDEYGLNVSFAMHWVNMIGKDNAYGELLTISRNERTEVSLFLFNINFSLFYRK